MQQMAWREALEEADAAAQVETLAEAVRAERDAVLLTVGDALDVRHDPTAAAAGVRTVMFMDRFLEDVDRRLESFDD
jgi:molecular chaperone HscB